MRFARTLIPAALGLLALLLLAGPISGPSFVSSAPGLEFDPELAKQLLSESQYGDDLPAVEIASSGRGASGWK